MARSADAARLTEAHRLAQVRLGGLAAAHVADLWRLVDPTDLDGSTPTYLRAVTSYVTQQYETSARTAANYYAAFRSAEVGMSPYAAVVSPADDLSTEALVTSLVVTGPARTKAAMRRGLPVDRAAELGQYGAAGAAMRHSLMGGRETLLANIRADRRASGFQRVTSGNACSFCEDLSSQSFGEGADFEAHDHCSCSAEPVLR